MIMSTVWFSITYIPSSIWGAGREEGRAARRGPTLAADFNERSIGARRYPPCRRRTSRRPRESQRGRGPGADGPPPRARRRLCLALPAMGEAAVGGFGSELRSRRPALGEPARDDPAGDAEHHDALLHRRASRDRPACA